MGYSRKQLEQLGRKARLQQQRNDRMSLQQVTRHAEIAENMKRLRQLRLAQEERRKLPRKKGNESPAHGH